MRESAKGWCVALKRVSAEMGAGASNPVDDSLKQEIQEFIKDSVATFGIEYAKSYATAAWYFARMEARREPKPWKLNRRPVRLISPRECIQLVRSATSAGLHAGPFSPTALRSLRSEFAHRKLLLQQFAARAAQ